MYYVLSRKADADGLLMRIEYTEDHRARSFSEGIPFTNAPGTKPWLKPPAEPIELRIVAEPDREGAPVPTFVEVPIPVMSRKLFDVVRGAGVDNIDGYRAELHNPDGSLVSADFVVFNLVGVVRAVDLQKSKFDADQSDREISMTIDSAVVNASAARGLLMFRLAENIMTILVHERVKNAIEAAGIELVNIDPVDEVALL